jgi:hypothetical protein
MTYMFENRGSTMVNLTSDDVSVPLFTQNQWQKVNIASANPSLGSTYTDEDNNSLADAGIALSVTPGAKLNYTIVYTIESNAETKPQLDLSKAGTASDIPNALVSEYTNSTDTFMANNTDIATLARSLTSKEPTVLGKLSRLVNWFNANVTYSSSEIPKYPSDTLKARQGDCDDQSILLISMLRSLGIPSYLEIGIVINAGINDSETSWNGHLAISEKGIGWHGWTMVYTPPWGWIPVDLTLIHDSDPMKMIQNAPEYTPAVVSAMRISKQSYTTLSVETRNRIVNSNLFIASTETIDSLQQNWINPTMLILATLLVGAVAIMFYTTSRGKTKPEHTI